MDRNFVLFCIVLVSPPLCRCTPVARISLKVCMVPRIFAQSYHHTPLMFSGLGEKVVSITLVLPGAEAGGCCPYLLLSDISSFALSIRKE